MKTVFQKWFEGSIGNFGSFQTAIFQAYKVADSFNMKILESSYPQWFTTNF